METLEDAIRRLIKEEFESVPKFADLIGVPQTSIYSALERGMANTRTELTDKIYRKLNIDWDTARLDDFKELKLKKSTQCDMKDIPMYGAIAAGDPIEMLTTDYAYPVPIKVTNRYPNAFLLKVEGNSMDRILPDGCLALVDPCKDIEHDGKPYAICVNGYNATIKRVRKLNNGFQLVPDSTDPTYQVKTYNYNDPDTQIITVIGEVVYYILPYDWSF